MKSVLENYLDQHELAAQLKVNVRTIYRWLQRGDAPPHSRLGRRYLFSRESMRDWLQARESQPAKPRARR